MSATVSLRKRRSIASRPITNRPQTITGQQNKALNEEQERERQAKELDARRRRARRRLDELERINYRDAPSASSSSIATGSSSTLDASSPGLAESPAAAGSSTAEAEATPNSTTSTTPGVSLAQRRRNQAEIKRILVSGRRNLHSIVEELVDQGRLPLKGGKAGANWRSARSAPSSKPGRRYCSICGYHGDLACIRCGHRYCSRKCRDVHDETRCERPLR